MLLYHHGDWLVKFFWIISGFVFAFVYWSKNISLKKFFVARFARLYPLHLITLGFIVIFQTINYFSFGYYQIVVTNDLYHLMLQFFMASNWGFQETSSFNSPIWSISVEVLVYALFFSTLKFLNIKPFLISITSLVLLLLLSSLIPLGHHFIAQCGFFFYTGVLMFLITKKFEKKPVYLFIISMCIFIVALYVYNYLPSIESTLLQNNVLAVSQRTSILIFMYVVTMGLTFSGIILFLAWIDTKQYMHVFSYQFKWVGNSTYSIYLWHVPIQVFILFMIDTYAVNRAIFDSKLIFLLWILFMIVVGRLSYIYIESPLKLKIKKYYGER